MAPQLILLKLLKPIQQMEKFIPCIFFGAFREDLQVRSWELQISAPPPP